MAKYSYELKKQVVKEYLNGEGGYGTLCKKHGVSAKKILEEWVAVYKEFGDEGLKRSRKMKKYSFEEKLFAVELYESSELSYQDAAIKLGMNNQGLLVAWVRRYRAAGPEALREQRKGRKKTMGKSVNEPSVESKTDTTPIDTSKEHVKELEAELLKLRIENAFLKELRRLRLEEEAKTRERLASLAVSEDNSD